MSADKGKIFNDPIHGTIELHPFLVKIIDTPEFQRLRHIKQMGGTYYVYPEAQHNRFEHSIGTAHLAGKLVRHLQKLQPELSIDKKDVLCVEIAGLCHDLGHGPFSHMFDGTFMKGKQQPSEPEWKHEQGSCDMLDRIKTNMQNECEAHGIRNGEANIPKQAEGNEGQQERRCQCHEGFMLEEQDFTFIEEMIKGPSLRKKNWPYKGRKKEKSFLYEIISNKTSGVDVDKWDYFARDCHHLGITTGFDHSRFIKCTRVIEVVEADGQKRNRICVRNKEVFNLYEMFHTRFVLHKRACHHPVVNAVEHMICDALDAADQYPLLLGDDGKEIRISECVKHLSSFCELDDRILLKIQTTKVDELRGSKEILDRLSNRDLYKCVGNAILGRKQSELKEEEILAKLSEKIPEKYRPKANLKVSIVKFGYGKGKKDPIESYWFYKKEDPKKAFHIPKEQVSSFLPDVFEEKRVQVYWKNTKTSEKAEEALEEAKNAFSEWHTDPEPSVIAMFRDLQEKITCLMEKVDRLEKSAHDQH